MEKSVKKQSGVDTFGLAVNIDSNKVVKSPICYVCSKLDDKKFDLVTFKCPNFLTSQNKVNKLKSLGICNRCASSDHATNDCKFKF